MSILNQFYRNPQQALDAGALFLMGPVLRVQVEIADALAATLQANNSPIPQPVSGYALIDTGATRTCVDAAVAKQLAIQPVGITTTLTAGGAKQQHMYSVKLVFPGAPIDHMSFTEAIGVD